MENYTAANESAGRRGRDNVERVKIEEYADCLQICCVWNSRALSGQPARFSPLSGMQRCKVCN